MTDTGKDTAQALRDAADAALNKLTQDKVDRAEEAVAASQKARAAGAFGRMKDFAENIALVAATIRAVKNYLSRAKEMYVKTVDAIKNVPVIGPGIAWLLDAVPDAVYRFHYPREGENFLQSSRKALQNSVLRPCNWAANKVRAIVGKEKIPFPIDTRKRELSPQRLGASALISAWALSSALSVPIIGDSFEYVVLEPPADATRMTITAAGNLLTGHGFGMSKETLHCGLPHKADGDDFLEVTCGVKDKDGRFEEGGQTPFVSRPGRFLSEIYSWTHGHGPHDPARVLGSIKPDATQCEVTYYGTRMRLAKWANFKPEVLNTSCTYSDIGGPK